MGGQPGHLYRYKVESATPTGSGDYYVDVTFETSASGLAAPWIGNYPNLPSQSIQWGEHAMFSFYIPPPPAEEPQGGFVVGDLLNFLASFGSTGVAAEQSGFDFNVDGTVGVTDLMVLLAGYGNPNQICQDVIIPSNINHQLIGPDISICEGHYLIIQTGSVCSITL